MRAGAAHPERAPSLNTEMKFLDRQQWPYIFLRHLAGDASFEEVVAAAQGPEQEPRHAEAFFYLAELALIRNDPQRAHEYLKRARSGRIQTAERYLARLRLTGLATDASAR